MKRRIAALLSALALLVTGCAAAEGMTLTDTFGREVTLSGPAARIVVLQPADLEILFAIGAGDRIVGRGEACDYPAEIADIPTVSSGAGVNAEEILALDPDVIVVGVMDKTENVLASLEAGGAKVVVTDSNAIEDVYACIELMGAITGLTDGAKALADEMRAGFQEIGAEPTGKTVYFEVSPLEYGLWTAGMGTFMTEIAAMLGVENAFADVEGWKEISQEQVLARDPDYIVTLTPEVEGEPSPVEEILSRPGWSALSAVQNGNVFCLDPNLVSRPGPRLIDAARSLGEAFAQ